MEMNAGGNKNIEDHRGQRKAFIAKMLMLCIAGIYTAASVFVVYKLNHKINETAGAVANVNAAQQKSVEDIKIIKQNIQKKVVFNNREDGSVRIECLTDQVGNPYTLYQLPMTDEAGGCSYALEMPNGKLVMFDSGYLSDAGYIHDFIVAHGGKVDSWFITHPHFDHVGGLIQILNAAPADMTIEKIYYAPFTEAFFTEEAAGKDMEVVNNAVLFKEFETLRKSMEKSIQFIPVTQGQKLAIEDVEITCMNSFQEQLYDVNGNSLVLRLDIKGVSMMITGDITDVSISSMIEGMGVDNPLWDVDFIQIPHHGYQAGISSDKLYRMTSPYGAFVDCSTEEYDTNAVGIRGHLQWLEELNIPVVKRFLGVNELVID